MYDARILMASAIFAFHMASCHAESVQNLWATPVAPDFTTEVMNGAIFDISWDASLWQVFSEFAPTANVANVDLWCMGYYNHQLAQLVSTQVNVKQSSNVLWKVALSADYLASTDAWVFRFLPHGTTVNDAQLSNDSVSSPGLSIVPASAPLAQSTTTTPTTSAQSSSKTAAAVLSSSVAATNSSSTLTTSTEVYPTTALLQTTQTLSGAAATSAMSTTLVPIPTPAPSHTDLSTETKAGIGAGTGIGACALLGIVFCAIAKTRKRKAQEPDRIMVHPSQREHGHAVHEMNGGMELADVKSHWMLSSGSHPSSFAEMKSATRYQPQAAPVELP